MLILVKPANAAGVNCAISVPKLAILAADNEATCAERRTLTCSSVQAVN